MSKSWRGVNLVTFGQMTRAGKTRFNSPRTVDNVTEYTCCGPCRFGSPAIGGTIRCALDQQIRPPQTDCVNRPPVEDEDETVDYDGLISVYADGHLEWVEPQTLAQYAIRRPRG